MYLIPDIRSKNTHTFYVPESKAIVRSRDFKAIINIPESWKQIKVTKELTIIDQQNNSKPWLEFQDGVLYWDTANEHLDLSCQLAAPFIHNEK